MSIGPYGEKNYGQTFQDKIKEYLKEHLKIRLELNSTGWAYYESDRNWKEIKVKLVLDDEVISHSDIEITQ